MIVYVPNVCPLPWAYTYLTPSFCVLLSPHSPLLGNFCPFLYPFHETTPFEYPAASLFSSIIQAFCPHLYLSPVLECFNPITVPTWAGRGVWGWVGVQRLCSQYESPFVSQRSYRPGSYGYGSLIAPFPSTLCSLSMALFVLPKYHTAD